MDEKQEPIMCGDTNIQDFVKLKTRIEPEYVKKLEELNSQIRGRRMLYSVEKNIETLIHHRLYDTYYDELDLNIFKIQAKHSTEEVAYPKFVPIPIDGADTFKLTIIYSADKAAVSLIHADARYSGRPYERIHYMIPILCNYLEGVKNLPHERSVGAIDSRHPRSKEVKEQIKKLYKKDFKRIEIEYRTQFWMPNESVNRMEEAEKTLKYYQFYFMIESKPEYWNSNKRDVPKNIVLFADSQEKNRTYIIDKFNPVEIPGDIYG